MEESGTTESGASFSVCIALKKASRCAGVRSTMFWRMFTLEHELVFCLLLMGPATASVAKSDMMAKENFMGERERDESGVGERGERGE